jgi:hypothetical protein
VADGVRTGLVAEGVRTGLVADGVWAEPVAAEPATPAAALGVALAWCERRCFFRRFLPLRFSGFALGDADGEADGEAEGDAEGDAEGEAVAVTVATGATAPESGVALPAASATAERPASAESVAAVRVWVREKAMGFVGWELGSTRASAPRLPGRPAKR